MSRAPRGEAYTITCTAFTCPVSTAAAPATVAKRACPPQRTLSAMRPSLNTCESAPALSSGGRDQRAACLRSTTLAPLATQTSLAALCRFCVCGSHVL